MKKERASRRAEKKQRAVSALQAHPYSRVEILCRCASFIKCIKKPTRWTACTLRCLLLKLPAEYAVAEQQEREEREAKQMKKEQEIAEAAVEMEITMALEEHEMRKTEYKIQIESVVSGRVPFLSISASRGLRWQCGFCLPSYEGTAQGLLDHSVAKQHAVIYCVLPNNPGRG
jgi:hypothetical protein